VAFHLSLDGGLPIDPLVSTLTIETRPLRKLGVARRFFVRVLSWIQAEIRLAHFARVRSKAENGDPKAQFAMGAMYETGTVVSASVSEALKWYKKAAFQGVAEAQLLLGLKYLAGQGVLRNESEALLWLRKAAEQGQPDAQYHLGNLYRDGRGTLRDLLQAAKWYRKAADHGHEAARKCFKEANSGEAAARAAETPTPDEDLATFSQ